MMDDLISRQAAIDALDKEYRYGGDIDRCGLSTALDEIEDIPAADAVPVVRCRECKFFRHSYVNDRDICESKQGCVRPLPDGFCSYGERKE